MKFPVWIIMASGLALACAGCSPTSTTNALRDVPSNVRAAASNLTPPVFKAGPRAKIDSLISYYSAYYKVPETLVKQVVNRESTYNPAARNGIHIGLMQINPQTARTMGHTGSTADLYDPATNLKYGVKYLAGAYLVAGQNSAKADRLYQSGYYYHAKRMGLLKQTGLR